MVVEWGLLVAAFRRPNPQPRVEREKGLAPRDQHPRHHGRVGAARTRVQSAMACRGIAICESPSINKQAIDQRASETRWSARWELAVAERSVIPWSREFRSVCPCSARPAPTRPMRSGFIKARKARKWRKSLQCRWQERPGLPHRLRRRKDMISGLYPNLFTIWKLRLHLRIPGSFVEKPFVSLPFALRIVPSLIEKGERSVP